MVRVVQNEHFVVARLLGALTPCQCRSCLDAPANPILAPSCRAYVAKMLMGAPLLGARPIHALLILLVPRDTCRPHPLNLPQDFCSQTRMGAPPTEQVIPAEHHLCNVPNPTLTQGFYSKE